MAEQVALGTYLQEIETRIRKNRSADALGLCKHILKHYPKHLETYGLMAQALAAQRDESGALDIYRRVLSADPENASAYAGLARIFDNRQLLEEAVWHLERAYELAPAQAETRKELLRLYARLEGAPRERLKLTRGALARLYIQEGLFAQAIREFREIDSATPSRYDARVALAETLWRAGQTRQAADVAQSLLSSLPYCLKANLIIGTAWHESGIEESESFLKRAQAIDPSNQAAQRLLGERSPLRPVQVKIPRYPGAAAAAPSPSFESTLPSTVEPTTIEGKSGSIPPPAALEPETEPIERTFATDAKLMKGAPETEASQAQEDTIAKKDEYPRAFEQPKPESFAFANLPAWLRGDGIPTETSSAETLAEVEPSIDIAAHAETPVAVEPSIDASAHAETPTTIEPRPDTAQTEPSIAVEPSADAGGAPDWLAELRKTFAEQSEEGIPPQALPMPTMEINESWMITEPTPVMPVTEEPAPVEPAQETRAVDSAEVASAQSLEPPTEHVEETLVESEHIPLVPEAMESTTTASVQVTPSAEEESADLAEMPKLPVEHIEAGSVEVEPTPPISIEEESTTSESVQQAPLVEEEPMVLAQQPETPPEAVAEEQPPLEAGPPLAMSIQEPAPAKPEQSFTYSETESELSETEEDELPSWLRADYLKELAKAEPPQEKEIPAWLKEPHPETSPEPAKPPPEIKMPKWVEVLSHPPAEEEVPARGTVTETPFQATPAVDAALTPEALSETPRPEPAMTELKPPSVIETPPIEPFASTAIPESPAEHRAEATMPRPKRQPQYYWRLVQAREHRDENRWSDAFVDYEFVIQKAPRLVNEVITDLEALVTRGDAPLDAHRLLGDAYARAGRLNDALERYRFVYEHLSKPIPPAA